MRSLPEGTVTFLFSDVEGSTKPLEQHGANTGNQLHSTRQSAALDTALTAL